MTTYANKPEDRPGTLRTYTHVVSRLGAEGTGTSAEQSTSSEWHIKSFSPFLIISSLPFSFLFFLTRMISLDPGHRHAKMTTVPDLYLLVLFNSRFADFLSHISHVLPDSCRSPPSHRHSPPQLPLLGQPPSRRLAFSQAGPSARRHRDRARRVLIAGFAKIPSTKPKPSARPRTVTPLNSPPQRKVVVARWLS